MACQYELKHANEFDKLILVALSIISSLSRVEADLLVILLEGGEVLSCLGEFSLLHTLTDIPVDKGPLSIHQVKLMVEPGPGLGDGSGVREHADCSLDLSKIAARDDSWGLVVDAHLWWWWLAQLEVRA